jgi:hypothetical protein
MRVFNIAEFAVIELTCDECGEHEDQRQGLKGENEAAGWLVDRKRRGGTTEIAEHKRGSDLSGVAQRDHDLIEPQERVLRAGHHQQHDRESELETQSGANRPPGKRPLMLAEEPGKPHERDQTQRSLQREHVLPRYRRGWQPEHVRSRPGPRPALPVAA